MLSCGTRYCEALQGAVKYPTLKISVITCVVKFCDVSRC